jgi:hypothetical protein
MSRLLIVTHVGCLTRARSNLQRAGTVVECRRDGRAIVGRRWFLEEVEGEAIVGRRLFVDGGEGKATERSQRVDIIAGLAFQRAAWPWRRARVSSGRVIRPIGLLQGLRTAVGSGPEGVAYGGLTRVVLRSTRGGFTQVALRLTIGGFNRIALRSARGGLIRVALRITEGGFAWRNTSRACGRGVQRRLW